MPFTEGFPFRRLGVDHMVEGVTKVWWDLDRSMKDAGNYSFQLQVSMSGVPTSTDWQNIGSPATNVGQLDDDEKRLYGKRLHSFYRVLLTTGVATYASKIASAEGELSDRDWLLAREIVRKERVRHNLVSRPGYLLRRIRYGEVNEANRDPLVGDVMDSRDRTDYGTGFKGGYFAPVPMQCWDLSPESIDEKRNGDQPPGQSRDALVQARVLGFPSLNREDVWVDAKSDQRWFIHKIDHLAEIRGVPVAMQVTMKLLPFTHVIYKFEVGGEPAWRPGPELPTHGTGSIRVDHDYSGLDVLAYQIADGCGIGGATILAFTREDYDAGRTDASYAVAASSTQANGRWAFAMLLNPGHYVFVFEKVGEYGPDVVDVHVVDSSSSSSASSESSESPLVQARMSLLNVLAISPPFTPENGEVRTFEPQPQHAGFNTDIGPQ